MRATGSILVDLALAVRADLGCGSCFGLGLLGDGCSFVHSLDDAEKDESHDQEADEVHDEDQSDMQCE